MTRAVGAAIIAIGISLIAGAGPAAAVDSGRARRNNQGSVSDLCNQFKREYRQLLDKQNHHALTNGDRRRMRDLNGQIRSMCSN